MLMFLAIFSVSVAATLLVQAADIEGVKARRQRAARVASQPGKAEASYPNCTPAGALR